MRNQLIQRINPIILMVLVLWLALAVACGAPAAHHRKRPAAGRHRTTGALGRNGGYATIFSSGRIPGTAGGASHQGRAGCYGR